jgi:hypothetical protein
VTLCMAWRDRETVHFASDSRLTLAQNSYADVGMKVLALPYQVFEPAGSDDVSSRPVAQAGQLGMCFAGSAVNSLTIKESLVELLKSLQRVPQYTDTSMAGVARFAFTAYKLISREVCKTVLGPNGRADILIGGMCSEGRRIRVFRLSTDDQNVATLEEVLMAPGDCVLMGSVNRHPELSPWRH